MGKAATSSTTTLNEGDGLQLLCVAYPGIDSNILFFALTKDSQGKANDYSLTGNFFDGNLIFSANNGGMIYDDFNGIKSGKEQYLVFAQQQYSQRSNSKFGIFMQRTAVSSTDIGTFYCGVYEIDHQTGVPVGGTDGFGVSSGFTLDVLSKKTKQSLKSSSQQFKSGLLKYTGLFLGASKILL